MVKVLPFVPGRNTGWMPEIFPGGPTSECLHYTPSPAFQSWNGLPQCDLLWSAMLQGLPSVVHLAIWMLLSGDCKRAASTASRSVMMRTCCWGSHALTDGLLAVAENIVCECNDKSPSLFSCPNHRRPSDFFVALAENIDWRWMLTQCFDRDIHGRNLTDAELV